MTHPTDEELDEMARDLSHTGELSMLYRCEIADAITALRAQLASATYGREVAEACNRGLVRLNEATQERADRAEAALAAQIETDAGIAEEEGWEQDKPHLGITEREEGSRDCAERIAAAIRTQPHDRTALDRIIAATRAEAMREAAKKATIFLVGDPQNGIPFRNPMAHEVADAILARADQIEKGEKK